MSRVVTLGIHCGYQHDSGASVLIDGEIFSSISEERMSRIKKDSSFPELSIIKCLEVAGVSINNVTEVFIGAEDVQFQPFSKRYMNKTGGVLFSKRSHMQIYNFFSFLIYSFNKRFNFTPFKNQLHKKLILLGLNDECSVNFINHHDCHMASVFFTSKEMAKKPGNIFCVDGYGDSLSVSVYKFSANDKLPNLVVTMDYSVSPGLMYGLTTKYLGMKPNRHEGKVTGLAAYGNSDILYKNTKKFLEYNFKKREFVISCANISLFSKIKKIFLKLLNRDSVNPILREMQVSFNNYSKEDIAAAIQRRLDNEIKAFISDYIDNDKEGNIFLAGGVFANVLTNKIIAKDNPFSEIYIHPGMTDEGVSLGAALFGYAKANNNYKNRALKDVYLGSNYNNDITYFVSQILKHKVKNLLTETGNPEAYVANLISQGAVIGLFQGGMEYGPRALGNRSILMSPVDRSINTTVNDRLNRTEYMPFAPVVTKEDADQIFHISKNVEYACKFMTIVVDVKFDWIEKIPAVVHIDNTARPQIIDRKTNKVYYDLVKEFGKLTGVPVLVNTSFNIHEEPIVESPKDAIKALDSNAIDFVYMPPYLIGGNVFYQA
jgi:carbamoyltransferase